MRRILLVGAAVIGGALAAPDGAQAQHFGHRHGPGWSGGFGHVTPGYGFGHRSSFYGGYPGWHRGHFDYHPGHFHGFRYIPPHIDYHHRGHSHAVDPWTGAV